MVKFLIGGSPCTHWSIAQSKNRETAAAGIGWELFRNYLIAKEKFKEAFRMSICRGCGREIDWIRTVAGKNMPIDPAPVFVIEGGGNDRFVTDEGEVITGRVARPEEESRDLPVAFVPHWKTCPNAGDFRQKRRA